MVLKNKFKFLYITILLISLLSLSVSGVWVSTGRSNLNDRQQTAYDGYYVPSNNTNISLNIDQINTGVTTNIIPLSADFDSDGLEEIFVYDNASRQVIVYNIDSSYNLIQQDTLTINENIEHNPAITTLSNALGNELIYVIRTNVSVYALRYIGGSLQIDYQTNNTGFSASTETVCANQGATGTPICYWLASDGKVEAWDIEASNNSIVRGSTIISSALLLDGITPVLHDIDGDTVKEFYFQTLNQTAPVNWYNVIGVDGTNISDILFRTVYSNPINPSTAQVTINRVFTGSSGQICWSGSYTGTGGNPGRSEMRCYNSTYGLEYSVIAGTSTISSAGVTNSLIGDFNDDGTDEYMLVSASNNPGDVSNLIGRVVNIATGSFISDLAIPMNLDDALTGNLLLNDGIGLVQGNSVYSINSSGSYNQYSFIDSNNDLVIIPDTFIISDFNGNGYNDILFINDTGLFGQSGVIQPNVTNVSTIEFEEGNEYNGFFGWYEASNCVGSTITFQANRCLSTSTSDSCTYFYDGTARQRIVANVEGVLYYGNWVSSLGDFTLTLSVPFALSGTYNVVLYVQTEDNANDFTKNSGQILINVNGDQQGINCNKPEDFLDSPTEPGDAGSKNEGLDNIFNVLLGNNNKTKFVIGIGMLIGLMVFVAFEFTKHGKNPHWLILLIVFILGVVLNTMLGLFPAWFIVLMIMVAVIIMFFIGSLKPNGDN